MLKIKPFIFSLLAMPLFSQTLLAQEGGSASNRFWGNFGGGALKSTQDQADAALILSAGYQYKHHMFTVRYMYATNYCEIVDCKEFVEAAVLYGLATRWRWMHASVSTGVGLASIQDGSFFTTGVGQYVHNREKAIGLALDTHLFWSPLSTIGIGLYGFGNLNAERNMFGAMLTLQIGKLF